MNLKIAFASVVAASAMLVAAQAADVTTTLTGVHICCGSCVKAANGIVAGVSGLTGTVSQEDGSVALTGPDVATVQKGVDALTAAGFFGKSSNPDIKVDASTGAKGATVTTLTISDVHLCCPKCVKAVNAAIDAVPGVTGPTTAAKGSKTFVVTGSFNDADVFAALQKAGFTGKVSP